MEGENQELKGGHPPAMKVGGMRVVQHKAKEDKAEAASSAKPTEEEKAEFGEDRPVKAPAMVMVSGAMANEESAFPVEAVKSFHEKPMPTHDKMASQKPKIIQQPKK